MIWVLAVTFYFRGYIIFIFLVHITFLITVESLDTYLGR